MFCLHFSLSVLFPLALESEHLTAVACGQTHTVAVSGECLVAASFVVEVRLRDE